MRVLLLTVLLSALAAGSFWVLTQGPLAPSATPGQAPDAITSILQLPAPVGGGGPAPNPHPATDKSSVQERLINQTYAVTGRTAGEVLRSLLKHGPREGEEVFFGLTQTELSIHYDPRTVDHGCEISNTEVLLEVVVTLPEWLPATDVEPDLLTDWGRFRRALADHEAHHRVIALGGAETAYQAVEGLRRATCDEAVAEARARLEGLGIEVSAVHRRFDTETAHGKTTGATWPQP